MLPYSTMQRISESFSGFRPCRNDGVPPTPRLPSPAWTRRAGRGRELAAQTASEYVAEMKQQEEALEASVECN